MRRVALGLGAALARRRPWLTLLTALTAALPIVCAMTVWLVDSHSEVSQAQTRAMQLGTGQMLVRLEGANSPERAAKVEEALTREGLAPVRVVQRPQFPVEVGGHDVYVGAIAKPWEAEFAEGFHPTSGRGPRSIDEVAVTPALAGRGLALGFQVMVGSRPRTVVGIATTPGWSGTTEAAFLSEFGTDELATSETQWVLPHRGPSRELVQSLGLHVQDRAEIQGRRTVLTSHPFVLGATVLLAGIGLLLCVRMLTGRTVGRTARALAGVGATRQQVASSEALATILPATVGVVLGWVVFGLEFLVLPDRVASANNIERPHPAAPLLPMVLLSVLFVVLAGLPAWWDGRRPPGTSATFTGAVPSRTPRQPVTPAALGLRIVLSARRRSMVLAGIAATLCVISVTLASVTATADAQKLASEQIQGGIRDGAVRVYLRKASAGAVQQALQGHVRDVHPLYGLTANGDPVALRGVGAQTMCPGPVVVDDLAGFRALTGRDLTPTEKEALERGDGLGIREGCGTTVELMRVGKSNGQKTSAPTPVGPRVTLLPAAVEPRLASQYGAILLRRHAQTYPAAQVEVVALVGDVVNDSPSTRSTILTQLATVGVAANAVAFGGIPHESPPLVVVFVAAETLLLMLAFAVASAFAVGLEERPTQRTLANLGMPRHRRAVIQLISFGLPLLAGLALGTALGLAFSYLFAAADIKAPLVVSPLAWAPWTAATVLPVTAWATTRRD